MFGFSGEQRRVLHLTWFAFFLTFVAWFNMAPFNSTLIRVAGLTQAQALILMICNVALTIPARIVVGSLTDRFGPRTMFTGILFFSGLVSILFALSQSFTGFLVSRLLMGIGGAGFVVGIKMIGNWFPDDRMGIAQGIYAGWGNFGAAAATFALPLVALGFSEETGWRAATAFSGILCLIWAVVFYKFSQDSPHGKKTVFSVSSGPLTAASAKDFAIQTLTLIPIYGAMLVFVWKLSGRPLPLIPSGISWVLLLTLLAAFLYQVRLNYRSKKLAALEKNVPESNHVFSQVLILSLVYALTFGSQLAVISMFPKFLESAFHLSVTLAGILGSGFAFLNLFTRPSGGWLSDLFGRKRTLFFLVIGSFLTFWFMAEITSDWPLAGALALCVACSAFIQAGSGACFALVPHIKKELTGKMAGIIGAYGNVGAVFFLTALSFVGHREFFKIISVYGFIVFLSLFFLQPINNAKRVVS